MSVATVEGARVIHALPGRIRVHFPGWSGHGQWKVERRVRGLPGVRHVEANGLTGNVLICFDPAASDEQTLLAAVADAAKDTETLLEDGPFPPVLEETVEGTVRRARVAVRGIDRDPQMARFVVNHLRRLFKVHAWASPLTGRVMIEYDDSRVGLNELLAYVRQVELPELPGEDRPAHPLDPAPLVQSASRTAAAGLGLAVLAVWRWAGGPVAPGRIKAAATAAGVITLLNGFPSLRNGLRRLLGRHTADVFFSIAGVVTLTLARSPLGLAIVGAEALVLLTEVVARRAAWTRYEEHMEGAGAAEPGAVIRLEAGECAPLTARVIEGVGTATGRDGLPLRIVPGSEVLAGARLFAGPFVVQLTGGEAFLPGPRPGNLAPSFLGRYLKVLGPLSLGYAALSLVLTRSPARAFTALLLVNPRVALVGLEAANLYAAARVLRGGVTVVETRPERVVQLPDVLLLDRPRVLTDGLEVAGVMPSAGSLDATAIMALASGVSAGAGSPWGNAFPRVGSETATDGSFNGLWAKARVMGEDYTLGPPEDPPEVPGAFALQYRGGYLLALCRGGHWEQPLGLLALRPRLSPRAAELVQTCKRRGVCLKVVPRGSRLGAQAVARRAGVELTASDDAVAVVRELQQQGKLVALVSDSALAAPAFAACDLAIGLTPSSLGRFPARVDLLAADLGAVAAILEAGVHRDVTVRDAVLLSAAANVFGAVWGFRDRPGVERASLAVYAAALAALADGWVRMQGGARAGSSLHYLVDPRPERWGRQAAANALRAFRTSEAGLAFGEAAKRQRAVPQSTRRHEVLTSILDQLGSPVNAILGGGAILSFAIGGEGLEVIIIAATVALNTVLGAWQEHQAGRATEAMRQLGTATARVLRDGAPAVVPASDVVPGDILLVEPGDRVPADARLLTAHGLEVDEAPLTGESVPVSKHVEQGPPEARIVLEGSDVAVGTGRAVVVAVGRQTRLGSIAAALDLDETRQSTFGSRLSRLMQLSLPVAAAGGITVFAAGLLWGKPAFSQLGVGVSIALAVVPESLPLLAGTGQVGVARRLADRRVLLRRLSAVEALGRVDVACADKTGTLTEGRLSVRLVADSEHEALLATLADDGLRQVLLTAALASPHPDAAGASAHRTDVAIVQAARDAGLFEALSPGAGARPPSTRAGRSTPRPSRTASASKGRRKRFVSAAPAYAAATVTRPWMKRAGRRSWIGLAAWPIGASASSWLRKAPPTCRWRTPGTWWPSASSASATRSGPRCRQPCSAVARRGSGSS